MNLGPDQGKWYNHEVTFWEVCILWGAGRPHSRSLSRGSCEVVPQQRNRARELPGRDRGLICLVDGMSRAAGGQQWFGVFMVWSYLCVGRCEVLWVCKAGKPKWLKICFVWALLKVIDANILVLALDGFEQMVTVCNAEISKLGANILKPSFFLIYKTTHPLVPSDFIIYVCCFLVFEYGASDKSFPTPRIL